MATDKLYRYFNFEPKNPFNADNLTGASMVWACEQMFEEPFAKGDFSWLHG